MLPERRAVAFDLDDTLYPYRRFQASGFAAVADHLERLTSLDAALIKRTLIRAHRGASRGRELQHCLSTFDLSPEWLPELLAVMRDHAPSLRLTRGVRDTLAVLRREGWRLAILTNGERLPQRRKLAPLGLNDLVDAVLFAPEHGSGVGKPEAAPFAAVSSALGVPARHTVFVGNDETCDVLGALGAGMSAIRCEVFAPATGPTMAHHTLRQFPALPVLARRCLEEASSRHAA